MKKYFHPLGLVLAAALLVGGGYAASAGDSLVSLGYLRETFSPKAVQAGEAAANSALQKTYDNAKLQLDAIQDGIAGGVGVGLYSDSLRRQEWTDGQIITLSTGGSFLMLDGSATVVHTGAVVDVTTGTETISGAGLMANHHYIVGEDTEAAVTIRSGAAALGVQGSYALMAGKERHTPFYDVSQSDWFYNPVNYAYEQGLFSGVDAGHFSPGSAMNRAMLMSVLHRMAGSPPAPEGASFTDVPAGQWYTQAVLWGASQGVTSGIGNGAFSPDGQVTREQAVGMLYNYAYKHLGLDVSEDAALTGFGDLDRVSGWARPAMSWAVGRGIISGASNGGTLTLDPQRGATRAEMAVILRAFQEKVL